MQPSEATIKCNPEKQLANATGNKLHKFLETRKDLPYITRSCFFTDLEGFLPSRSVGMPRDPLYHLERRKGKLRLSRAKIKLNQRLSRKPKPYHLLRLSRGCHQTIPTSLEGVNHTIFTSLEGQNHTKFTSLEELNHTILKSLNSAKKLDHSITYVSRGQNHTFKTII